VSARSPSADLGVLGLFDLGKARHAQELLSARVREEPLGHSIRKVCAMDVSYKGERGIGAVVVVSYPDLRELERHSISREAPIPYISGFLAFREMPFYLALRGQLKESADLYMINGHGLYHPACMGSASHFGVVFNEPTVGVASRPLKLEGEERQGSTILVGGRAVCRVLRDSRRGLYVSVGHRITLEEAEGVVRGCLRSHRLPEPLFLADSISRKVVGL